MRKEQARIWLDVSLVRMERLQEIGPRDINAEGYKCLCRHHWDSKGGCFAGGLKIFSEGDWAAPLWKANPWVWVVEFKRTEATP